MASTIKVKRSSTASAVPASLAEGELAANTTDGKLFLGKADTSVVQIGGLDPTGDSMTGDLNMQDNQIIRPKIKDYSMTIDDHGTPAGQLVGWNLSSASYENISLNPSEGSDHRTARLSADGTKLYVWNQNGNDSYYISQYSLSTAWDISTASYANKRFQANSNGSWEIHFSPDGTKLFTIDVVDDKVYRHTLSTAWDISTASFDTGQEFYTGSQTTSPYGLWFKEDGTIMYVGSASSTYHYEYSLSTAWDLTTVSYSNSYNWSSTVSTAGQAAKIFWKDDGTKWYLNEYTAKKIHEFTVSTAWSVSTSSLNTSYTLTTITGSFDGMCPGDSGRKFYAVDSSQTLFQYEMAASGAASETIDCQDGNVHLCTVSSYGMGFTFSNPPASGSAGSFVLELTNGGSGTVTWPASIDWEGGTAPTLTAAGTDILVFYTRDGGTTWHGIVSSLDSK